MNSSTSSFDYQGFCKRAALGSLLLVIGHFAIFEAYTLHKRRQVNAAEFEAVIDQAGSIEVAAIGTSHLDHLAVPQTSFLNLAQAYTFPTVMYFKVKHLLKHNPNLQVLILEADELLFYQFAIKASKRNHRFFVDEPIDEASLGKHTIGFNPFTRYSLDKGTAPIVHRRAILDVLNQLGIKIQATDIIDNSSDAWLSMSLAQRAAKSARRVADLGLVNHSSLQEQLWTYYKQAVNLAVQQGAKVILLRTPRSYEYYQAIPEHIRNEVSAKLQSLAQSQEAIKLIAWQQVFADKPHFFRDPDHLSDLGLNQLGHLLHQEIAKGRRPQPTP